jgi:hypothetical protein
MVIACGSAGFVRVVSLSFDNDGSDGFGRCRIFLGPMRLKEFAHGFDVAQRRAKIRWKASDQPDQ